MKKRLFAAGLALAPLASLLAVHPVAAAPLVDSAPVYGEYGLTALAAGVRTAGDVGVSGGLVTLDTASAYVTGSLDASPSGNVLAVPVEPGTLFRTVVGQGNDAAGQTVADVPDAEAAYPGTPKGDLEAVPSTAQGPLVFAGGTATARAAERSVSGAATGASSDVAGLVVADGSTSSLSLVADPVKGTTTATATTRVGRLSVAGVLELRDVVATATTTAVGDVHKAVATLSVGSASVAGQEVGITDQGVVAAGTPLLPLSTLDQATAAANAALSQAGITVRLTGARKVTTRRSAEADTGGIAITFVTPDLPAGLPGNSLQVLLGAVSLTASDALYVPRVDEVPVVSPPLVTRVPPTTIVTVVPGTPGTSPVLPGTTVPGAQAPELAPVQQASYQVAGRRVTPMAAVAAFGVWQFLTLGTSSLYSLWDRRRRQELAG